MEAKIINMHEAKTHLSRYVQQIADGEAKEIILGKADKPMARLVPIEKKKKGKRKLGGWEGKIWIADDFDAPDPEIEELFYGKGLEEELKELEKDRRKK